jgi:DeoR/GlpR family transcriptional regulator of sugar metabolism
MCLNEQVGGSSRHAVIIESLRRHDRVSVQDLAIQAGTSEMTIRRDLDHLESRGVLRRVRGGAVSLFLRGEEPPFAMREMDAVEAKQRIAREVGRLIAEGEAVIVDSGTTGLEVARVLAGRHLTVMALSMHAAMALSASPRTRVIQSGGELRAGELATVGPLAESSIRALRFDTAVITCCGLSPTFGLTSHDLADAAVKRTAIEAAQRVVVAADSSKFAKTALASVCPPEGMDVVVTDTDAPADAVAALEAAGIEVRLV